MTSCVLDTSVVFKWFAYPSLKEEDIHPAMEILDALKEGIIEAHCPQILLYEMGSALSASASIQEKAEFGIESLLDLPLVYHQPSKPLLLKAVAIRKNLRLSFYDASFVALAEHLGTTLFTADHEIHRKCPSVAKLLKQFRLFV